MLYENLPSKRSIRLMKLLPGAAHDPIVCQLEFASLDSDGLDYPAVSYVWGDPKDKKPIQCSGETLMIPSSLFSFLQTQQDEEEDFLVWADAVCINQGEDSRAIREREQQVEMMGDIFSKASYVILY